MEIKFFKKENKIKKGSLWFDISFYWKISVFVMSVATMAFLFFGYYFFMKINKETILESGEMNSQAEKARKDRISKVLEYFSLKNQKSEQILSSPSSIVDPSL